MQVECYRKQLSGEWQSQCYESGEIVEIESVHFKCAIEQVYHKVLGFT